MKNILSFWVIGCLFSGLIAGLYTNVCPKDKVSNETSLTLAALWPATATYLIARSFGVSKAVKCEIE